MQTIFSQAREMTRYSGNEKTKGSDMGVFKRLFNFAQPTVGCNQKAWEAANNATEIVLDSAYAATFQTEINIDAMIASHQALQGRLQALLNGTPDPALQPQVLCLDYLCHLGRWLHGPGREVLGASSAFDLLVARHQYFHAQAAAVVAYHHSGEPAKAQYTLDGTYRRSSTQVVLLLNEFKRQLGH